MYPASVSLFESLGGVKTVILVIIAIAVALYLRRLSRQEKKEKTAPLPSAEELAALPDKELVDAVVRDLLSRQEPGEDNPLVSRAVSCYRSVPLWSNGQVNLFSVWLTVRELAATTFDGLRGDSVSFLPLAEEGFAQIGAPLCQAAVHDRDDGAFEAAVAAEDPIALCAAYVRDNMDMFAAEGRTDGNGTDHVG